MYCFAYVILSLTPFTLNWNILGDIKKKKIKINNKKNKTKQEQKTRLFHFSGSLLSIRKLLCKKLLEMASYYLANADTDDIKTYCFSQYH